MVFGHGGGQGRDIPCHGSGFRASFVSIRECRVIRHITSARPQSHLALSGRTWGRKEVASQSWGSPG